jgi:hypothetical protein
MNPFDELPRLLEKSEEAWRDTVNAVELRVTMVDWLHRAVA